MVRPDEVVPPPIVEEALDWKPASIPREVREEAVTPDARVAPVRLAAATVPEKEPDEVMLPTFRAVANRLVDEAVVAKKLVLVELVVVDWSPVKFWRVEEPDRRMLANEVMFAKVLVPLKALLFARSVEEAAVIVMLDPPSNDVPFMVRAF